ncbi:thiamine pyrophosphate-binding protein [Solirubrobacter soli]|uniref:thiamine pyrophosphate-binding protein n=1 Tax=Solirubrobacter soli TaxID=363832 RepID=UPI0003FF3438|nr:thiamine pyrophosphate-binding protein [Solirubrobacter soli]
MTVAEVIAARLGERGVERAFGFPGGGSNLDLIEAFAGAGIEFVLAHTEVSAALMACAWAELTGTCGVVVVGNGPGLASVVNGVAHAWLDRVPLVVFSDRYTEAEASTTGHQILDQRALLAPVVKWSATVDTSAGALVDHALAVALSAPCGPVHLDMPRTVGAQEAREGDAPASPPAAAPLPAAATPAPAAAATPMPAAAASPPAPAPLDAAVSTLAAATNPVIVAGLEAARTLSGGDLAALAERLGAPVLTTYKAKGVIDESHPLWAGIVTGGAIEAPILDPADVVVAVGFDPVELLTKPWPWAEPVAVRPEDVPALAARLPQAPAREIPRVLDTLRIGQGFTTWRIIEILDEELPDETVAAVDAGAHMFAATWFWRAHAPRRFLISNGLATMGFAVPAAVAAARDGLALAITGDGGMAYGAFELETAVRLGARVLVVVIDDASLSLIRIKHEAKGHDRSSLDFRPVSFDTVAAGFGVASWVADDEVTLRRAVREALSTGGPALIDARCSGAEYARTLEVVRG